MGGGFQRLRHYPIIGGDHQHCNIGDSRATRPHCSKRLVAGGVEEGYSLALHLDLVRADVLGDAARFSGNHVG